MVHPKLLIIGLDSAAPALVFERWRSDLPTLAGLMARGAYGPMRSTHPPITVPAWTSMMASRDPGELGF
ncbi:MAG: phosphodiesterase, partial [Deltaproteobacteria bacterium]